MQDTAPDLNATPAAAKLCQCACSPPGPSVPTTMIQSSSPCRVSVPQLIQEMPALLGGEHPSGQTLLCAQRRVTATTCGGCSAECSLTVHRTGRTETQRRSKQRGLTHLVFLPSTVGVRTDNRENLPKSQLFFVFNYFIRKVPPRLTPHKSPMSPPVSVGAQVQQRCREEPFCEWSGWSAYRALHPREIDRPVRRTERTDTTITLTAKFWASY